MNTKLLISILAISLLLFECNFSENSLAINEDDKVDFNFHIRPILSDRCFKCHGPDAGKREADLRLDTPEGAFAALKDNPSVHAIMKGNPSLSEVYLRISATDSSILMPPPESNLALSTEEIALIKKWIAQGAEYKPHWAFISPQKSKLPKVTGDWAINEIDHFVFDKMAKNGFKPNEEASKSTLLKRLYLDLIGLPPSLEEQDAFLADQSENAYEKVVNKLLASKHYGEKMAAPWLDVARYADSHGYQDDGLRTMWPWRDWVIHAFNSNYSYKKFITWQLAGDLLPQTSKESILATGFNRNHKITQEGGVIDEEYRVEYVTDRTNTFGKGILALTFECAKCHDHKYDPISQKEYYSTFAFFNQVPEKGLFGTIDASFADPPNIHISTAEVNSILKFINKKDTSSVAVMVMKDSSVYRPTYILQRGNYDAHGELVNAALPNSILPFDSIKYPNNRYGLSQWLFDTQNPLTSRVFVNRIWEQIFGKGIVKSSGDFGMQGDLPSHPELLDWLAVDFRENGWNIKRLVKQMVMSATYRQSSDINDKHLKIDPENMWLARASRNRVSAENVRDLVLSSSGLLNPEIGGPSIKPYQPEGLWEVATSGRGSLAKYVQDHGPDLYRRGMYVFIKRTVPPPSMLIFDASNRDQCEVRRLRTNTPLQALAMLNDPTVMESSKALSMKVLSNHSSHDALSLAFRKVLCRTPEKEELKVLNAYFDEQKKYFEQHKTKAQALLKVGETASTSKAKLTDLAALMNCVQLMYNLEETLTKI